MTENQIKELKELRAQASREIGEQWESRGHAVRQEGKPDSANVITVPSPVVGQYLARAHALLEPIIAGYEAAFKARNAQNTTQS